MDGKRWVRVDGYWVRKELAGPARWWVVLAIVSLSIAAFLGMTLICGIIGA